MAKYRGASISGVSQDEFNQLLREPCWGRGKTAVTLQDVIDPHITEGKRQVAVFLVIALPLAILVLAAIMWFVFVPILKTAA